MNRIALAAPIAAAVLAAIPCAVHAQRPGEAEPQDLAYCPDCDNFACAAHWIEKGGSCPICRRHRIDIDVLEWCRTRGSDPAPEP